MPDSYKNLWNCDSSLYYRRINMKKRLVTLFLAATVAAGVLVGCGSNSNTDSQQQTSAGDDGTQTEGETSASNEAGDESTEDVTVTVYAAASLEGVLNEAIALYHETNPDVNIVLSTGSSGELMTQIEEAAGTDVDVFFSAATDKMDQLVADGYVDEADVDDLLKNEIVLIGAKDSGTAVTGFANITDAANIALADETVPVGAYAREAFESLGISVDDFAEVNSCSDVSAVKEAVKEGANEVGIVYYSDYYSVKDDVDLIEICDQSLYSDCIYPVATVNNPNADEAEKAAAADFVEFLQTAAAEALFEDFMFTIYE